MKWSWTIGRLFGIKVRMHWTFLLLIAWVGVSYAVNGGTVLAALQAIGFILAIFGCVILHEAGHALTARRFGVPTEDITLLPIGGVARMQRIPSEPWHEFWIAVAGPAVNVAIAGVIFLGLVAFYGLREVSAPPGLGTTFLTNLMWVNVALVLFNMLPAFPMDGGRVLRALLALKIPYVRATMIAAGVGQMMAIVFGIAGFFWNPMLLFIALFVYLGADAEARSAQVQEALRGATVRDAMMTRFRILAPEETLDTAVDELLAGAQQDFPVSNSEGYIGLLRRQDLIDALRKYGSTATVGESVKRSDKPVRESDSLEETLEMMRRMNCQSLPVLRGDQVVGIVSLENIAELMMVRAAAEGEFDGESAERAVQTVRT